MHPLALTRLGIILQELEAADKPGRSDWLLQPLVCIAPPDSSAECLALALPGLKRPQKHPVTRELLHCSHNGVLNVYGAPRGLLACAAEASQVQSVRANFADSAVIALKDFDVSVFLEQLGEEYDERHAQRWSKEGRAGLELELLSLIHISEPTRPY